MRARHARIAAQVLISPARKLKLPERVLPELRYRFAFTPAASTDAEHPARRNLVWRSGRD
ncbi:hypothetical protein GW16_12175 [Xanthomonas arboricola pv. celebensis]|nr:hypothetical protein GW16_12175 [Xanthomonas arboricola pv. celebensis]